MVYIIINVVSNYRVSSVLHRMLIGCSSGAHRVHHLTSSLPCRERKLLLKPVLELAENQIIKGDGA